MANEGTPQVSTLTKVYYATDLTSDKTQLAYVQEIPQLFTPPSEITWSALDIDDERMAKGRRTAESMEIPFLFTEEQWDNVASMEDSDTEYYWFFQLPEATATTAGKPLTFYFKASCAIGNDTISIDEMIQAICKLYRSTEVLTSKGFPTA